MSDGIGATLGMSQGRAHWNGPAPQGEPPRATAGTLKDTGPCEQPGCPASAPPPPPMGGLRDLGSGEKLACLCLL